MEFPDSIDKHAKIRSVELGTSLKEILLRGLDRELADPAESSVNDRPSYWANRQLLPEYAAAIEAGAFSGGADSTRIISVDRSMSFRRLPDPRGL